MAGQLPKVDERMAQSVLTKLGNRTDRFKANHPNWTPEGLAARQKKWAAGITHRHQMRRAGTPVGKPDDRPEPRPKNPDQRRGAERVMSTLPAPRRVRRRRQEARRREEGRREE